MSLILHRISSPPTAWRRQPLKEECCVSSFARCKRNLQNDIPIVFTAIVKMRSHRMHQVLAVLLCPYGNSVVAVPCAVSIRRHKWPNPAVAVHAWDTCCALSSSLSAPAAKSPAQRQYSHGNSNLSSCCQGLMYSLEIRDLGRAVFGTGIPGRPPFQMGILEGRLWPTNSRGSDEDLFVPYIHGLTFSSLDNWVNVWRLSTSAIDQPTEGP